MANVTFADALAALRAECGEPTWSRDVAGRLRSATWSLPDWSGDVVLYESGGAAWIETAHGDDLRASVALLAGDGRITPLADAVRDAGAWLRGRREVGDG